MQRSSLADSTDMMAASGRKMEGRNSAVDEQSDAMTKKNAEDVAEEKTEHTSEKDAQTEDVRGEDDPSTERAVAAASCVKRPW